MLQPLTEVIVFLEAAPQVLGVLGLVRDAMRPQSNNDMSHNHIKLRALEVNLVLHHLLSFVCCLDAIIAGRVAAQAMINGLQLSD